jgi:hypothetical protein
MTNAGGADIAVMAAIANAIKAVGAIVQVEPDDFVKILGKTANPLVVRATGGLFKANYQYLAAYKGLIFFTKSRQELMLSGDTEIVRAKSIIIPD